MRCKFLAAVFCFCFCEIVVGQSGLDALKNDYPLLMEKFGEELENQRADYYFLVDVSGTMQKYKDVVVPALQEFLRSMQADDYVSVIKFGGAAKNDIGSHGKVSGEAVNSLLRYVPNLYNPPTNKAERDLYYKFTDLEAMLAYLADELHQPGRNKLKFVFIITDFIHEPMGENKGKVNLDDIRKQFKNQQIDHYLYPFALQLPGKYAGKDLKMVTDVFPTPVEMEEVADSAALSVWFTEKKNRILLDKFAAVVKHKFSDLQPEMKPVISKDGYLTLDVSWKPNRLFDQLSVDEVVLYAPDFQFKSILPATINGASGTVHAGKINYQSISFPFLRTYADSLTVRMTPVAPYTTELQKLLGYEGQLVSCTTAARSCVFTFILPFWVTIALMALLLLYLICVFHAFRRNRSVGYKINGTFLVRYQGDEIGRKKTRAQRKIDMGTGASFLPVAHQNCVWLIEIKAVTYSCFLCFKKPEYRLFMHKGNKFKTGGHEYMKIHHPRIARGGSVVIDDFSIKWIP